MCSCPGQCDCVGGASAGRGGGGWGWEGGVGGGGGQEICESLKIETDLLQYIVDGRSDVDGVGCQPLFYDPEEGNLFSSSQSTPCSILTACRLPESRAELFLVLLDSVSGQENLHFF
jgi:hypothetical protein